MSFAVELWDNLEAITQRGKDGLRTLNEVTIFFKDFAAVSETSCKMMTKVGSRMQVEDLEGGLMGTIHAALFSLLKGSSDLSSTYSLVSRHMRQDVIEPLEIFTAHFEETQRSLTAEASKILRDLATVRNQCGKVQSKFYATCRDADLAEQSVEEAAATFALGSDVSSSQYQKLATKAMSFRSEAEQLDLEYQHAVEACRAMWQCFDTEMPRIHENLQHNEESRISFIKFSVEKFVRVQSLLMNTVKQQIDELSAAILNVNSKIDVRVFCDEKRQNNSRPIREEYVPYQGRRASQKSGNFNLNLGHRDSVGSASSLKTHQWALMHDVVANLFNSRLPNQADLAQLRSYLHTYAGRRVFLEELNQQRSTQLQLSEEIFDLVSLMLKEVLSRMVEENDRDVGLFRVVMILAQTFYRDVGDRRQYVQARLNSHEIWKDRTLWEATIMDSIRVRVQQARLKAHRPSTQGWLGQMLEWTKAMNPNTTNEEESTQDQPDSSSMEKNIVFAQLGSFAFHMLNFGLPTEEASQVLLQCCTKEELDKERTWMLLAELEANRRDAEEEQNSVKRSLRQREKERKRFGGSLPLSLAISFLSVSSIGSLVLVSRSWRATGERLLLKVLSRRGVAESERSRVWGGWIRKQERRRLDYDAIVERSGYEGAVSDDADETILLDAGRCFPHEPRMYPQELIRLLRAYAYFDSTVGYCQGMNFIGGWCLLHSANERDAFDLFVCLMENYDLKNVFNTGFSKLKLFYFQLDRLLGMLLPDLHKHFKTQMITASQFASSWFITLFSNMVPKPIPEETVGRIWDMFLLDGWKAIFRVTLAILAESESALLDMNFEEILLYFSAFPDASIFDAERLTNRAISIKITSSTLRRLEVEYDNVRSRALQSPS